MAIFSKNDMTTEILLTAISNTELLNFILFTYAIETNIENRRVLLEIDCCYGICFNQLFQLTISPPLKDRKLMEQNSAEEAPSQIAANGRRWANGSCF